MKNQIIFLFLLLLPATNVLAINVTLTTTVEGNDKPVISGKTNLPDGTDLSVSLSRKSSSYSGQCFTKVNNGQFKTTPYTQHGAPLNPGNYVVSILTPYAPVQPKSVQKIIGGHGEYLKGALVKKEELGKLIRYKTTYKVAGLNSPQKDKEAREKEKVALEEWQRRSCYDICTLKVASGSVKQLNYDICVDQCMAKLKSK